MSQHHKFVNPSQLIAHLELRAGDHLADLGCGAGFYAIPAGKAVGQTGFVYAIDIQEQKLTATQSAARGQNLKNIRTIHADLEQLLTEVPEGSCDVVLMDSIIHEINSRLPLFKNAYRLLKTGGKLLIVEWKTTASPLGPAMHLRIPEEIVDQELKDAGFTHVREVPADNYHYAHIYTK